MKVAHTWTLDDHSVIAADFDNVPQGGVPIPLRPRAIGAVLTATPRGCRGWVMRHGRRGADR